MGAQVSLPFKHLVGVDGSVFETLSNDVLLELFDYFSADEIDRSFSHLNDRLDTLIYNYPQHVNLQWNRNPPPFLRSLKLTGRDQIPLFYSLRSSQLSTIRGLTVGNLQAQQILDICNVIDLRHVEYVYLGVCREDMDENDLVESVQTKILALGEHRLRRCHLRGHLLVNSKNLPASLPSLEYVHLDGCKDFSVLSSFLARMPNLNYLRVSLLESTEHSLQKVSCRITHLLLRSHPDCSHPELKLFLSTCCSSVENILLQPFARNTARPKLMAPKQTWAETLPDRVTWFYLKKLINSHYPRPSDNVTNAKLYDTIWLMHNEECNHPCQAIIEEPFSSIW